MLNNGTPQKEDTEKADWKRSWTYWVIKWWLLMESHCPGWMDGAGLLPSAVDSKWKTTWDSEATPNISFDSSLVGGVSSMNRNESRSQTRTICVNCRSNMTTSVVLLTLTSLTVGSCRKNNRQIIYRCFPAVNFLLNFTEATSTCYRVCLGIVQL